MTVPPSVDPAEVFTVRQGAVTDFDGRVGAGTVTDDDPAGRTWPFHCTRIADGTRTIEVGAAVTYRVEPGPTGIEAVALTSVSGDR